MELKTASPTAEALPDGLGAEIDRVFARQQAARQRLRDTTAKQRVAKLKALRERLFARRADLHAALHADFRKAPEEVDLTELGPILVEIKHTAGHLRQWMRPKRVGTPLSLLGTTSSIRYEPKGVALIIAPWNYPANLTLGPLVGAIAAGCPAMLKPSEHTPHTNAFLRDLLGPLFGEDEVALFEGGAEVAQALLHLPFNHIYFTGSPAVGKIVMKAAAEHLTSVTLELGGKSPTIVDETADVEEAAMKIAFGKFSNKGQTCIAPDHVYVHESQHDAFVTALTDRIHAFYGPDAQARATTDDYARIVNDRHHARLTGLYEEALEQGATAATGGTATPATRFIDPTVLTGLSPEARVMREEIFGPILPILPFRTLTDVVADINSRPMPLALYLFSRNEDHIAYVLDHTTAGGTCINDTLLHFMHPELPFGGIGTSGMGQAHGYHNFLAFTNERPVLRQKLKNSPFKYFYPPYTPTTRRLIDVLLRLLGGKAS